MNRPSIEKILGAIEERLRTFKPTSLSYLDPSGTWGNNPSTLRDRISNEIWFTIWENKSRDQFAKNTKALILPILESEESWKLVEKLYELLTKHKADNADPVPVTMEALYHFVEFEISKRLGETYVPSWDRKRLAKTATYKAQCEIFLNDVSQLLTKDSAEDLVLKVIERLSHEENGIFNRVCTVVAEEEKLRWHIDEVLKELAHPGDRTAGHISLGDSVGLQIYFKSHVDRALLRPCVELLANGEIDISSGIQYETSGLLGKLRDIRSTETLLATLKACRPRHTNLRCNLIYALGNIKQEKTLGSLLEVLNNPDSIEVNSLDGSTRYVQPIHAEKCEAIWALGKLGIHALEAVPILTKFWEHSNKDVRVSLAWALGMIGSAQKQTHGGIDARVIATLLNLLTDESNLIFEEAAFALRELGLPDFLHSLYLHNFATIPILALKPSSTGLYELSETLLHLISAKRPVVVAVTGDSGTGKTYFCQVIADGFGGIEEHEILYLMRDKPTNKIFNRMLGLKWLKDHIDPKYYEDYSLDQDSQNPDEFFAEFMARHINKKLIILDGWRDEVYFHQIIKKFYEKGYLDVLVNFRTTFSTRRANLEEREGVLESVKTHLPLVEEPAIEDSSYFKEGEVLIYNLDNSIGSRLDQEETREIFARAKIGTWGDQIRIGEFKTKVEPVHVFEEALMCKQENFSVRIQKMRFAQESHFTPSEKSFERIPNDDIESAPNLLQIIQTDDVAVSRIAHYRQGQISFGSYHGDVGIMTGFNDRILYTNVHETQVVALAAAGDKICSLDNEGILKITSFHNNFTIALKTFESPPCSIASLTDSAFSTGHEDGTIRLWNVQSSQTKIQEGHQGPVVAIAGDRRGRTYSCSRDAEVRVWDTSVNRVTVVEGYETPVDALAVNPNGSVVMGTGGTRRTKWEKTAAPKVHVLDLDDCISRTASLSHDGRILSMRTYFDGRIIVVIEGRIGGIFRGNVCIVDLYPDHCNLKTLTGHELATRDCITMGPRLITCGTEGDGTHTLRIWGTESYVRSELQKQMLMRPGMAKPAYYYSLF